MIRFALAVASRLIAFGYILCILPDRSHAQELFTLTETGSFSSDITQDLQTSPSLLPDSSYTQDLVEFPETGSFNSDITQVFTTPPSPFSQPLPNLLRPADYISLITNDDLADQTSPTALLDEPPSVNLLEQMVNLANFVTVALVTEYSEQYYKPKEQPATGPFLSDVHPQYYACITTANSDRNKCIDACNLTSNYVQDVAWKKCVSACNGQYNREYATCCRDFSPVNFKPELDKCKRLIKVYPK